MLKKLIIATRPFTFTVTIFPILIVFLLSEDKNVFYLILTSIAGVFLHAGINIFSDYFDFKNGVDQFDKYCANHLLVSKDFLPKDYLYFSILLFFVAVSIAIYFLFVLPNGITFLIILILGSILSFGYCTRPLKLKYRGLGDLAVFLGFGPFLFLGAATIFNVDLYLSFLYSIPLSFLVIAILHANNIRDMEGDKKAKIKTMAIILDLKLSKLYYLILLFLPYFWTLFLFIYLDLNWTVFLVLLTLPLAFSFAKSMWHHKTSVEIETHDQKSAMLHLLFSILFIISLLIS